MSKSPIEFWQDVHAPGSFAAGAGARFDEFYPATLPDGRQLVLPIRVLPGGDDRAVASLIINQASFAVLDTLADVVADRVRGEGADVVVALPTLGLPLGEAVARRLGHSRMVALGTSRKFWYDEALSQPMRSITSPGAEKRLYVDPRMLPLLKDRRVLVVDDVLSTGASMSAALGLLDLAGVRPVAVAVAMLQGNRWRARLGQDAPFFAGPVVGAFSTPLLARSDGGWVASDH